MENLGFPAVAAPKVNATGLSFSHENVERGKVHGWIGMDKDYVIMTLDVCLILKNNYLS